MGIYAKVNGEWKSVDGNEGTEGLMDWSTLLAVEGAFEKKVYVHEDVEWVSYTFIDDGKFKLDNEGLIEILLVASGSMESNNSGNKGGGVVQGIEHMYAGEQEVVIGKGGATNDINASYIYKSGGEILFAGSTGGGWSQPASSGNGGADLSGNGIFSYIYDGTKIGYGGGKGAGTTDPARDYGQGNPPRANSGGATTKVSPSGSGGYGADGVCIIRVPKKYAENVTETLYRKKR